KVTPGDWLGAVDDQSGRVVVRTHDNDKFSGSLAPADALKAVGSGEPSGFYTAQALSGEDVLAAYRISPLSGWSIHFALPSAAWDLIYFNKSVLLAIAGAILIIGLASLLIWMIRRDLALRQANAAA